MRTIGSAPADWLGAHPLALLVEYLTSWEPVDIALGGRHVAWPAASEVSGSSAVAPRHTDRCLSADNTLGGRQPGLGEFVGLHGSLAARSEVVADALVARVHVPHAVQLLLVVLLQFSGVCGFLELSEGKTPADAGVVV